eukprot:jgi/Mesen1/8280/ME000045S07746
MGPKSKSKAKRRDSTSSDTGSPTRAPLAQGSAHKDSKANLADRFANKDAEARVDALAGQCFEAEVSAIDTWIAKDASASAQCWLTPAQMNAKNVAAGSLVAVALVQPLSSSPAGRSPATHLPHNFERQFGLEAATCPGGASAGGHLTGGSFTPGLSYVVASAWPSPRLPRNGVRISWQLSDSLARPPLGSVLRLYCLAVKDQLPPDDSAPEALSGRHLTSPQGPTGSHARSSGLGAQGGPDGAGRLATWQSQEGSCVAAVRMDCRHLALTWCPPADVAGGAIQEPAYSLASPDDIIAGGPGKAGASSAPKRAPGATHGGEGQLAAVRALLESRGGEQQRGLLEKCLLQGNCVVVPVCGHDCVFHVSAAGGSSDGSSQQRHAGGGHERGGSAGETLGGQFEARDVASVGGLGGRGEDFSATSARTSESGSCDTEVAAGSASAPLHLYRVSHLTSVTLALPEPPGSRQVSPVLATSARGEFGDSTGVYNGLSGAEDGGKENQSEAVSAARLAGEQERVKYSSLGGLGEQIAALRELVELPLRDPALFSRYGIRPPKGVLLHGPPGTGKTSLARAAASESGASMFVINGPEVVSQFFGESEQALLAVFDAARKAAPSVVFIDELDAIAPARGGDAEDMAQRMVAALLTVMDGGGAALERVVVIAATNRVDSIDPALRRPGRFDRELEVGVPTPAGRLEILQACLRPMRHEISAAQLRSLAASTHGFVGADLAALCNEAALVALRRWIACDQRCQLSASAAPITASLSSPGHYHATAGTATAGRSTAGSGTAGRATADAADLDLALALASLAIAPAATGGERRKDDVATEMSGQENGAARDGAGEAAPERESVAMAVEMCDFEIARSRVRPSAMREVAVEVPRVLWSDIGGQDDIKQRLQEAVEWPHKHAQSFARIGARPPRGVLLYGPPGCSKTLMARAVATEAALNFLAVKGPELFSKWVGESEKAVRALFARARQSAPSIVFFDEIDGLAGTRGGDGEGGGGKGGGSTSVGDRVLSQLLTEMDGLTPMNGVAVIAATNRPDLIDPALLRPAPGMTWQEDIEAGEVHARHFEAALQLVPPSGQEMPAHYFAGFQRG